MWCDTLTLHHHARARSGRSESRVGRGERGETIIQMYDYNKLTTMLTTMIARFLRERDECGESVGATRARRRH